MSRRIFVFGSNHAGRHGAGSARHALENHGAIYGRGFGMQGNSFAIPTKEADLRPMSLADISLYVGSFLDFARDHPELDFDVVAIGCGLAGYVPADIAPMFRDAPPNVHLPEEFKL